MITLFTTFFWRPRRKSEKMTIYVKGPDFNVPVDVDPESKVENIKETIASQFSLDKSDMAIFFSGRILDDFTSLQECNLSQQSVIHVATNCPKTKTHPVNISVERQTGFYIYCSTCGAEGTPRNGKIRVRCSSCLNGAIELHRDPESWSDVVVPDKILGTCKSCNADTSAEFYFKCCQHNSTSDEAVFLYLIKPNYSQVSCLACTEIKSPMLFPCENGHAICIQCFENYCTVLIRERHFILVDEIGYTVPCPGGCPDSFIKQPYHFKILSPHLYELYQKFATEEYVLKNGGVFCPKVNCGEGIFTDENPKVVCTSCRFEFCKMCSREFHEGPCDVQEVRRWSPMSLIRAGKSSWDERASKNLIKRIAKNCPRCKVTTEKDGGCMHIQCSRCGFDWCWLCQDEFTRDCRSGHWFG